MRFGANILIFLSYSFDLSSLSHEILKFVSSFSDIHKFPVMLYIGISTILNVNIITYFVFIWLDYLLHPGIATLYFFFSSKVHSKFLYLFSLNKYYYIL